MFTITNIFTRILLYNRSNEMFGNDVYTVQQRLYCNGYLSADDVNGIYNYNTYKAVTNYQNSLHLLSNGIVDNKLFSKLLLNVSVPTSTTDTNSDEIGDLIANGISEPDLATAIKNDRIILGQMTSNIAPTFSKLTTDFTAQIGKSYLCDTASNDINITLPTSVGNNGNRIIFKKINSSNLVNINPFETQIIDGNNQIIISKNNSSITLISDNVNWQII